jgi:hypothetical protein
VTIAFATIAAIAALSAAGFFPVAAAIGPRWFAVPMAPLAGAVMAGVAATASLSFGGPLLTWFVALALAAALVVFSGWVLEPGRGPWSRTSRRGTRRLTRSRVVGIVGFLAVMISCAWSLRGLRSPTVGFDARALWVMRPGWLLQSHAQLLIDMKARGLVLTQSAYPPLVSASAAVAWRITGVHTARLGVTTIAVLNACALAAAALALVECGRSVATRMIRGPGPGEVRSADTAAWSRPPWAALVTGVVTAVLLVFVAAGVTEPFLTNGYADPIWSLAAVGAVAYGLQAGSDRSTRAAAAILILVAGLSKNEGLVTAIALVALVAARSVGWPGLREGRRRWGPPVIVAACEVAVLAWWPLLMKAIGARGASSPFTTSTDLASRSSAVVHGMTPYLHVLAVALPLSVLGGLALCSLRRRGGVGNDLWAWLALGVGLLAVGGALVTGSGAIVPWIRSTVHRITEYPILEGWWIIAVWAVVASSGIRGAPGVPADAVPAGHHDEVDTGSDARVSSAVPSPSPAPSPSVEAPR